MTLLGVASPAGSLRRLDSPQAAPLADRELGFAQDLGDISGRVKLLHHFQLGQESHTFFDPFETVK